MSAPDTPVQRIVRKFGSQSALAEALGIRQPSISDWVARGFIPGPRHQQILDAGRALGIDISPDDFFNTGSSQHDGSMVRPG